MGNSTAIIRGTTQQIQTYLQRMGARKVPTVAGQPPRFRLSSGLTVEVRPDAGSYAVFNVSDSCAC